MHAKAFALPRVVRLPRSSELAIRLVALVLFGSICCRGLAEMLAPKSIAMLGQQGGVLVAALACVWLGRAHGVHRLQRMLLLVSMPFVVFGSLSCALTLSGGFLYGTYYWIFNLCIVGLVYAFVQPQVILPFHRLSLFWGMALLIAGVCDQAGGLLFPGGSVAIFGRPASLTGSYLHYPLVMSLFVFISWQWYALSKEKVYGLAALAFVIAPLQGLSRSGVFILISAMLVSIGLYLIRGSRKGLHGLLILLVGAVLVVAFAELATETVGGKIAHRILSAGSSAASGNEGRIHSWREGMEMWMGTQLLLGENTGVVTNMTEKLVPGHQSIVVESSPLQQLVNFGLLGLLSFYAILGALFFQISADHIYLRSAYVAALAQTSFYQSVEVIPFITLMILFPAISQSFDFYSAKGQKG